MKLTGWQDGTVVLVTCRVVALSFALYFSAGVVQAQELQTLTLDQAISAALKANPALREAAGGVDAGRSGLWGARAPANPNIRLIPWWKFEKPTEDALEIGLPLEVFGQHRVRTDIARAGLEGASADYRGTELDVIRDVRQAYAEVLRAQAVVDLDKETIKLAETVADAAQRQQELGNAPGAQTIKAQLQVALAQQDLVKDESDLEVQKARLNAVMGRDPAASFAAAGELTYEPSGYSLETVRQAALAQRPEIMSARAALSARRSEIKSARLQRLPDVELETGKDSFSAPETGVSLIVSMPLFDFGSIRGKVQQAEARARAQEAATDRVRAGILLDVQEAYSALTAAESVVRSFQRGVLLQSEHLLEMAKTGYQEGAVSYLELLEAQRTYASTHTDYLASLAAYEIARADLERAAGILPGMVAGGTRGVPPVKKEAGK